MDVFLTRRDKHIHMIAVCGEVDLATADELVVRLRTLSGTRRGPILLDLSQITFIDCAGLRSLRAFEQHVATAGGSVHVAAVSLPVARLFELLALHTGAPPIPARPAPAHGPRPVAVQQRARAYAIAGS